MDEQFDERTKYAQHDGVLLGDGREAALLTFILSHPRLPQARGSPAAILSLIDEFGRGTYLMNCGAHKGAIITRLIASLQPRVMLELGGYVGYSALLFGAAVRAAGGSKYYSLECNAEFARVSRALVGLAGLEGFVEVVVGACDESIKRLRKEGAVEKLDLLFVDHYKPAYTFDLKLCEELGLVDVGTTVVADNVIHPGAPKYLEYVRSTVVQKREAARAGAAREENPGKQNWYLQEREKPTEHEFVTESVVGNPNLVYEGELIPSFEPNGIKDGLEVTRCVGVEK